MRNIEVISIGVLAILYTLVQVTSISIYFNGFLNLRISKYKFYSLTFLAMGVIKLLSSDTNSMVKLFLFVVLLSICILYSFYGSMAQRIYHIIFFTLITTLADLALSIITYNYDQKFEGQLFIMLVVYFSANFLSLLIVMLSAKLLLYFRSDNEIGLSNKECLLLSIVPCLSLLSIYWIFQYKDINQFVPCVFLLIVNVCIMLIYNSLEGKNFLIHKYSIMETQNKYYEESLENQREMSKLKHDLKNILLNIAYGLERDRTDEVKEELQELLKTNVFSYRLLTGCIPIDAILHSKLEQTKKYNIECTLDLQVPHDLFIEHTIDLAAILGNLLDNAVEAVLRLTEEIKKEIEIKIKFSEDKLFIIIVNSSNHVNVDFSYGRLISEKGKNRYGIGISSINERVKKLKGYSDFSYDEGYFNSIVVLPNP
ncbi:GHKL domain-containing protein [Paenibacillus sp. FSL E2-8871]|uniref:GHKL domain-containing protein n=1 Tax=Paenibacillus sp. FSL E2-8871 TaxID=2975326 RepID=UPI0030FBB174